MKRHATPTEAFMKAAMRMVRVHQRVRQHRAVLAELARLAQRGSLEGSCGHALVHADCLFCAVNLTLAEIDSEQTTEI